MTSGHILANGPPINGWINPSKYASTRSHENLPCVYKLRWTNVDPQKDDACFSCTGRKYFS